MFKILKYLFYVIAIVLIGASVYIATLPAHFEHEQQVSFEAIPTAVLKDKLIDFESWKQWAIEDTLQFKVTASKDPLQSKLESSLTQKQSFKLENEQITDSLVVQKLYTANEKTAQKLTWNLGDFRTTQQLNLKIEEHLSFSDKLYELLNWKNFKRQWLLSLPNKLNALTSQAGKKAYDYTLDDIRQTKFGPLHYIYVTSSGALNHLEKPTQQHLKTLEQFLAEKKMAIAGKPFTIVNKELSNGELIFSTALPINEPLELPESSIIRYAYIEEAPVLSLKINGNPANMVSLWTVFERTPEATIANMSTRKYILYDTPTELKNPLDKEQRLIWEIAVPKDTETTPESLLDSLDTNL